jgi:hypothetical protein
MYLTFSIKKDYFEKNKNNLLKGLQHYFINVNYWEMKELPNQVLIECLGEKGKYFAVFNELRKKKILSCPIVGMPNDEYAEILWYKAWRQISKDHYKVIVDEKRKITLIIPDYFDDFLEMMDWYSTNHDNDDDFDGN